MVFDCALFVIFVRQVPSTDCELGHTFDCCKTDASATAHWTCLKTLILGRPVSNRPDVSWLNGWRQWRSKAELKWLSDSGTLWCHPTVIYCLGRKKALKRNPNIPWFWETVGADRMKRLVKAITKEVPVERAYFHIFVRALMPSCPVVGHKL